MTASALQPDDNVVRYASPRTIHDDGSVDGGAFRLRAGEDGLSINWLEYFRGQPKARQLQAVRRLARLTLRNSGRLAELNVGETQAYLEQVHDLLFVRKPLAATGEYPADCSHSEIVGLPPGDSTAAELIGDMIAECVHTLHPAVSP